MTTESNAGPIFLGFLLFFLFPSAVVGVKTMMIVAAGVASVCILGRLLERRMNSVGTTSLAFSPAPAPVIAVEANSASASEVESSPFGPQVDTYEGDNDHKPLGRFLPELTIDAVAIEEALQILDPPRPTELTVEELMMHRDRIDAMENDDAQDYEYSQLPYSSPEVWKEAERRIANRPPPRVISLETNRALGFLLSAFATEGTDYVATADIHGRESKNDDDIAALTPLQFAKRMGAWLKPTGITSEPLKPYIGGNRKGYVKSKVLAYVDAPGELVVEAP